MFVEKQLISLKKSKLNLVNCLTTTIEHELSLMKLNATIPLGMMLKKLDLSSDSEENRIINSGYVKEVLKSVEHNLYWKGYRVKLKLKDRNFEYEARLIDVQLVKSMLYTFFAIFLSVAYTTFIFYKPELNSN
jgi:hypothetical protein